MRTLNQNSNAGAHVPVSPAVALMLNQLDSQEQRSELAFKKNVVLSQNATFLTGSTSTEEEWPAALVRKKFER